MYLKSYRRGPREGQTDEEYRMEELHNKLDELTVSD